MDKSIRIGIEEGLNYESYRTMIDNLLEDGKTTGPNQSESYIGYTEMNIVRMNRLDKTFKPDPESIKLIENIKSPQIWLVITEAWCGDAAQIVPVINQLASLNHSIEVKHVLRDVHPELMELFLTNGAKSIPIVLIIDQQENKVIGQWGPRPEQIQGMMMERKKNPNGLSSVDFATQIQRWYAKDKTLRIQQEFTEVLRKGA